MAFLVGVHPNNLHLTLASQWGDAFHEMNATFVNYPEGRESVRYLLAGQIDVCGTGSTPPILAQASGADVLYLAASSPRPANGAILVKPDSELQTAADLKGRRVALLDGSFHTYLLAKALEAGGLQLGDVHRVELAPGPSSAALQRGEVDAWVAMAPHLDQSQAAGHTRILVPCGTTIPNRSVFWTLKRRGLSDAAMDGFVAGLAQLGLEIAADPLRAARLLAEASAGDADLAAWGRSIAARDWGIVKADRTIMSEQQAEADTLSRHGDLSQALDLAAAFRSEAVAA